MQPPKKKAWASPTLYLYPQTKPHSEIVELDEPPVHSHEPGSNPQTVFAVASQPDPETQLQPGSRSAKIMTMVWKASRAQARLVNTKCFNCHHPNSPQYIRSISSMQSFSGSDDFLPGSRSGERSSEFTTLGSAISTVLEPMLDLCLLFQARLRMRLFSALACDDNMKLQIKVDEDQYDHRHLPQDL
ncbi:hypothetical protein CFP56_025300 [Quercus suber]|uniref:Uncharacterized protein n=1 Tax=Quercus suber TaxID=58331 RepID=A0AAW0K3R5_QUESU